jgi:hypothetical protein
MHEALLQELTRRNELLLAIDRLGYRVSGGWSLQVRKGQLRLVYELSCPRCGRDPGDEGWLDPDRALASEMDATERRVAKIYIKHLGRCPAEDRACPQLAPYLDSILHGDTPSR